jgi:hypothetical protein
MFVLPRVAIESSFSMDEITCESQWLSNRLFSFADGVGCVRPNPPRLNPKGGGDRNQQRHVDYYSLSTPCDVHSHSCCDYCTNKIDGRLLENKQTNQRTTRNNIQLHEHNTHLLVDVNLRPQPPSNKSSKSHQPNPHTTNEQNQDTKKLQALNDAINIPNAARSFKLPVTYSTLILAT